MSGRDNDDVPVDADGQDDKARLAHGDNIPGGHELAYVIILFSKITRPIDKRYNLYVV
jgi:hypothetical protein